MIDKKEIEIAAKRLAFKWQDQSGVISNAFKEGINWLLGNLWHDTDEPMPLNRNILVEYEDKSCVVIKLRGENDRMNIPLKSKITRWFYIDDLMKGGNHE